MGGERRERGGGGMEIIGEEKEREFIVYEGVYMYVCMCVYVCIRVCMYVCMYVCMWQ